MTLSIGQVHEEVEKHFIKKTYSISQHFKEKCNEREINLDETLGSIPSKIKGIAQDNEENRFQIYLDGHRNIYDLIVIIEINRDKIKLITLYTQEKKRRFR